MASCMSSAREDFYRFRNCRRNLRTWRSRERIGTRTGGCLWKTKIETGVGGMVCKRLLFVGIVLLLLQNTLAFNDDSSNYEASGSTALSVDQATLATSPYQLAGLLMTNEDSVSVIQSDPTSLSKGNKEEPAFTSILSALASTAAKPQSSALESAGRIKSETNQSHSDGPIHRAEPYIMYPSSATAEHISNQSSASVESALDDWVSELVSSVVTARETGLHSKGSGSHVSPSKMRITTLPYKNLNVSTQIEPASQDLVASSVPQLTTVTTTTVATATITTTTHSPVTTTSQLTSSTQINSPRLITTTITTTAAKLKVVKTKPPGLSPAWAAATQPARATPARGFAGAHPTTTTTTTTRSLLVCNITDRMWVKIVLSIHSRRYRLDSILKQNLLRALTLATGKALNSRDVHVQIERLSMAANMTVGYYVTHGDKVYTPSVVVEALNAYGLERLIADIRQFVPQVQAVPIPADHWRPRPAISQMLKTVLRFVGTGDDVRSCSFAQMMEQRLQNAFTEAEVKVLSSHSKLTVQILTVTQSAGSPDVSLIYVVHNGSVALNGTEASILLSHLTAELVGYFLFYPPLITAEPLEYHNLNTSTATKTFWVITVIQDVEDASLESQYQSFASMMEQRLAELFVVAHQQGARFRRATTVGSYTVQMVGMRRVAGPKNPIELTYYAQHDGAPLPGTSAAKILNTVDSQTMALTLGYFVQLQAEPVVKNPSNNLWIIAAVLAPIGVVTIIIIIITAVLCRKNKSDFKTDAIGNLNPRVKTAYRRDVGYYHQPVQGFDYAKQHLGQQGGDEETLPVKQETMVLPLPIRDASLSLDKVIHPDGSNSKKTLTSEIRKSRLPSEEGSVISSESVKGISGRGSVAQKVTAQQKLAKEESGKRSDPYDTSSGSLQLISIKTMAAPPTYIHQASSDQSQDSANLSGEVSLALKQKSDIEHYRNKLRLKAKRKGYYDFPSAEGGGSSKALSERARHGPDRAGRPPGPTAHTPGRAPDDYDDRSSTYVKSHRRHSQATSPAYRSRQSLNSPSPGGTEMDLLVMRERPRKGIRNSGYDTEPELIEETDVDRLAARRHYGYGRQVKGHSETSTLSSQPSIDEVRQQMHLLLEEAFSLASAGRSTVGRRRQYHPHHHPYHHHQQLGPYSPGPPIPYSEVVTSAPGTMSRGRGGLQWVPAYGQDLYQCSLTKPTFRFTQLPEMALGSPPPIPPRTGPPPGSSLRRSSSDLGAKVRSSESSVQDVQSQHESNPYVPVSRPPLPPVTSESAPNHSGNPMTAVYAIPASRPGYTGYFISTPPSSYHSPSWMSYPPEPEDVPSQWADSVPLPGYAEAFPHPHYPQGSPLLWKHSQAISPQGRLEQPPSAATSQQSLAEPRDLISPDTPLSSLSTSALVKAIRDEVAKLAKKQADMFEFQV
ncbi:UPF0606 protein KIAA1549L isoform X3 [Electrophorus electricus]|uniref:UPF0606 protein KIAA1549L isoform X3 n=1 Tax=Electrophorus electricus TaxID=8005 RepID=UPI0015D0AAE3|nr:UPF0606 protein KIAA1549L isoform X3 [Electrophorus electricus]